MTTALYRRYRPETFAEMIGQSQVTDPLMTALRGDRVGHAYLFSGPRGCGKTTSARILARCLNCVEGPTDTPCGVCPSCVELSRDGGGSLDVVEIDAASHNGVDDARDLRERATFAPSRDRYKIFILDEAHMVTPQGFNALLKLVEEPPAHVKFIFATTEPEKVLGTIRSRTHHYPFRLVPPAAMMAYVEKLCAEEGVQVDQGVLALVVRAGGGSPRDTLSLLDQLIAGSDSSSSSGALRVSYERAVALLGYTHAELLDEIVEALAAADPAAAFPAVDRVVQSGQDPRRFVDDLLERLRDLIIIAAVGDGASDVLRGLPADELARMMAQSASFGPSRLSRTADLVSRALDDMTGATSPRLHLELLVARVLAGAPTDADQQTNSRAAAAQSPASTPRPVPGGESSTSTAQTSKPVTVPNTDAAPQTAPTGDPAVPKPTPAPTPTKDEDESASAEEGTSSSEPETSAPVTFDRIAAAWPAVLTLLESISRASWLVATGTYPLAFDAEDAVLTLGFSSPADVQKFKGTKPGQSASDHLRAAIEQQLGITVKYRPAPMPPSDEDAQSRSGSTAAGPSSLATNRPAPDRVAVGSGDDTPAAGWANPMSAPQHTGPEQHAEKDQRGGTPAASVSTSRSATAAVTEWAVAPIPTSVAESPAGVSEATDTGGIAATQQQFAVDEEPAEVEATGSTPQPAVDDVVDEPDNTALSDDGALPADEHPYFDDEPPYDPEYDRARGNDGSSVVPSMQPASASSAPAPRRPAVESARSSASGVERRGEAVVRQVLGAKFLREEPFEPQTRFS